MIDKHPDMLDQAADLVERERAALLAAHLQRVEAARLAPKGVCHNCEYEVEADEVFCDHECKADYEYIQKRREANR